MSSSEESHPHKDRFGSIYFCAGCVNDRSVMRYCNACGTAQLANDRRCDVCTRRFTNFVIAKRDELFRESQARIAGMTFAAKVRAALEVTLRKQAKG